MEKFYGSECGSVNELMLQDYGTAARERDSKQDWIASLQLRRGDQLSALRAHGQPEYFPLTQSSR